MNILKGKNFWIILFFDTIILALCYGGAFWLRFEGGELNAHRSFLLHTLPPLVLLKLFSFFISDMYRGMWRYAGIRDLLNVVKGSVLGTLLFVIYLTMVYHFSGVSRAIIIIDMILTISSIGGFRLIIRLYHQRDTKFFNELLFWRRAEKDRKKVLIVGTGSLAEKLLRELVDTNKLKYEPVGFVEKSKLYRGLKIHGIPILGGFKDLPALIDYHGIGVVLIADPELKPRDISEVVEICGDYGVQIKVIPSLSERINGSISDKMRNIDVIDLLEREPVVLNVDLIKSEIEGQDVLVTGAGGSIGSELCRQITRLNPNKIILFDNAETPLYEIDMELGSYGSKTTIIPCIGDIRSRRSLERVFNKHKPGLVYHAAAYKHVPMMEVSPLDAINNNIIGTYKLATVSHKHGVKKFVMISTDKAVRPTSIMGATKRAAELIVQSMNGNGTKFITVRFGNVLGSNGSVVPLFKRQIAAGGPVTVTHPQVTRYFMTIPEAVTLVLQAGLLGKGGELFILDMGEPVKILDLAKNMIRLAGLIPGRDVKIDFIGLRPGEKLYEELLVDGEDVIDTVHEKIKVCKNKNGISEETIFECVERFSLLLGNSSDNRAYIEVLKRMIPSFQHNLEERGFRSNQIKAADPEYYQAEEYDGKVIQ